MLLTEFLGTSWEVAHRCMPQNSNDEKLILVQVQQCLIPYWVQAWCHWETSHYLSQCLPRSVPSNGVTRPQWVNGTYRHYRHLQAIHHMVHYPTLAREFQSFRVWGKFVFRTLELTDQCQRSHAHGFSLYNSMTTSLSYYSDNYDEKYQNTVP